MIGGQGRQIRDQVAGLERAVGVEGEDCGCRCVGRELHDVGIVVGGAAGGEEDVVTGDGRGGGVDERKVDLDLEAGWSSRWWCR